MDNYKTIKELAEEFKVSKQAIQQKLTRQFRQAYVVKVDKRLFINNKGYLILKDYYRQGIDNKETSSQPKEDNVLVESDNDRLFEIIRNLQTDNKELHNLLDQQQQLTLQANKQIEQLQSQLFLSADEEIKEETVTREDTEKKIPEQEEPLKKWWQFWK